jgi:Protein of unknown function (DUF3365)
MKTSYHKPGLGKVILALAILIGLSAVISCTKNKSEENTAEKEPIPDSVYTKMGNEIVALTFDTLRNSLLNAISTKGMDGAITFCNEKAYPLTTTYADSVVIRRTALRYRNPDNKPDSLEQIMLDEINANILSGGKPETKIIRRSSTEEIHFFKPILLQPMCLNCHGTPGKQIQNTTLARIQQFYPDDRAVDYKEGDLRGLWHIVFKSQLE